MEVFDGSRRHDIVVACGGRIADLRNGRHGDFVHVVVPVDAALVTHELF